MKIKIIIFVFITALTCGVHPDIELDDERLEELERQFDLFTLGRMIKSADAIVVARVNSITNHPGEAAEIEMKVERILRGSLDEQRYDLQKISVEPFSRLTPTVNQTYVMILIPFHDPDKLHLLSMGRRYQRSWEFRWGNVPVAREGFFILENGENFLVMPEEEELNALLHLLKNYWDLMRSEQRDLERYRNFLQSVIESGPPPFREHARLDLDDIVFPKDLQPLLEREIEIKNRLRGNTDPPPRF